MTEKELRQAYKNLDSKPEHLLVDAGKCRHELDWLYGINLSRLLTESALKQGRGYSTLSTGRVQGPTMGFVVDRENEISSFVPIPYWKIELTITHDGQRYMLEYEKEKITNETDAHSICETLRGACISVTDIQLHEVARQPPYPFDLSTLQSEAYRHFGYSPAKTVAITERLYLDALVSYPRTSSQKLPPDIGYSQILQGIAHLPEYKPLVSKLLAPSYLRPNNGPREDPAHPAIYPTGEASRNHLVGAEARVYDLITRRFMSTFAESSIKNESRITLEHGGHRFFLRGSQVIKAGWTEFYRPYISNDSQQLPDLKIGDTVKVEKVEASEKFSQPPARYNPSSLLKKMEEENIGTKATRAGIIDILYLRGYLREERMRASELAENVSKVLSDYCPLIIDPVFTSNLETLMQGIQSGNSTRRLVLVEALESLRKIMFALVKDEEEVGSQLSTAVIAQKAAEITFDTPCPNCSQRLSVVRSRASGKRFVGCSGKWQTGCSFTLPLPQFGDLTILSRCCATCGFQMIQAKSRGRRPLISCPRCYGSKSTISTPTKTPA